MQKVDIAAEAPSPRGTEHSVREKDSGPFTKKISLSGYPNPAQRRGDRLLERKKAAFRDPHKSLDNFDFDFDFDKKMTRSLVFRSRGRYLHCSP